MNLRALAILLVMLGHSIILYSQDWGLYATSVRVPFFDFAKRVINTIQMPLFFSISGFCLVFSFQSFLNGDKSIFLFKKAKRILIPFLIVGLFWLIPVRLIIKYPGWSGHSILRIVFVDLIYGKDNGHL